MITIQKTLDGRRDKLRVTFTMPGMDSCRCLYLVGWFDESNESVYRMQQADDGAWALTLELEPGCNYVYCFRTDNGTWVRDPDTPCTPRGSRNSFIISRDVLTDNMERRSVL